jgi:hypothetical protein
MLLITTAHTVNATLYSKLGYSLVRDFAPVSLIGSTPQIVVVHPSVPVKTLKERARQGALGATRLRIVRKWQHPALGRGALQQPGLAGTKMHHIPYKGRRAGNGWAGVRRGRYRLRHRPIIDPSRQVRQAAGTRRHQRAALAFAAESADGE